MNDQPQRSFFPLSKPAPSLLETVESWKMLSGSLSGLIEGAQQ
jgi:hypothetical protein